MRGARLADVEDDRGGVGRLPAFRQGPLKGAAAGDIWCVVPYILIDCPVHDTQTVQNSAESY